MKKDNLKKINDVTWLIEKEHKEGMKVPVKIFASENLLESMDDVVIEQSTNVAALDGIQKFSFVMPDGHSGYGFPIGGVAGMDLDKGVISPGGIGFDINCGVRSITTNLTLNDLKPKIKELVDLLFKRVPTGVGCKSDLSFTKSEFNEVLNFGAKKVIENGFGWEKDLSHIEEHGFIQEADSSKVSDKAVKRGINQLGTLGSGNHYLELQYIAKNNVLDENIAKSWGINKDEQVCFMIHCGSRGLGHQVASDYLKKFLNIMPKYNLKVLDKELSCAPFDSNEGQDYLKAMSAAANMAFANRQVILDRVRGCFEKVFGMSAEDMEMNLVYDVAHNIAKLEEHDVEGKKKKLIMHRKGATRAFGPSRMSSFKSFDKTGQPVIIGGSMETGSYLLAGLDSSEESFCSAAHGSGRTMSRAQAKKEVRGEDIQKSMLAKGIYVKSASMGGLAEEAGIAYKDVDSVVDTLEKANITKKVVKLLPVGNIKG